MFINQKGGEDSLEQRKNNLAGMALGIAGLAFTAGALAAGAALMNQRNRKVLTKGSQTLAKRFRQVRGAFEGGRSAYQAVAHRVSAGRRGRSSKSRENRRY